MKTKSVFLTALLLAASTLRAQLVPDSASLTISNQTNSITGNVTVGTNGSFTLLVLSNNCLLTNSGFSTIGQNASAKSNEVHLVSPTARWFMGASGVNFLFIGSNGAANRLVVSNGATAAVSANAYVGYSFASSSNNQAWVTGPGSLWRSADTVYVGFNAAAGNQVVVSNGGTVAASSTFVGNGSGGGGNTVQVTGAGSRWTNSAAFNVGDASAGNRLLVSAGGAVSNASSYIGNLTGGSNNLVLITGPGSVWANALNLEIGRSQAKNNQLVVSNGADVFVGGNGVLGLSSGANSNALTLTDTGTRLLPGINTDLMVGTNGAFNVLVISNGASAVGVRLAELGSTTGAVSNSAVITGAGSRLRTSLNTMVGRNGAGNRLTISEGGIVECYSGVLGLSPGGSNNQAIVTGPGSAWTNQFDCYVGNQSPGNRLVVINGAIVVVNNDSYVGFDIGSGNNAAVVTGAGSVWTSDSVLSIGYDGSGNQLMVSNGAAVYCGIDGMLGYHSGSQSNTATVTGAGSVWSNAAFLTIGWDGAGNRLEVRDGGVVSATNIQVGLTSLSANNRVVVDGGTLRAANAAGTGVLEVRRGTNVLNAGLIDVDQLVLTNTLGKFEFNRGTLITRGAFINNGTAFNVGNAGGSPAVWHVRAGPSNHFVSDYLVVGEGSAFNQLLLTNGAFLTNGIDAVIGDGLGGNSNSAVISGAGSRWAANAYFQVGYFGSFNRLVISNGGVVANFTAELGRASGSSNNQALVTGTGPLWTNRGELRVGSGGGGNQLVVSNGGTVINRDAFVGLNSSSRSNTALVAGAGTRWLNETDLRLGYDGSNNQLILTNGAMLASSNAHIGFSANAGFNSALVTGAGTLWTNRDDLYVGNDGFNNQLIVSDGGTVICSNGFLSFGINSRSNLAVVTGPGSLWRNLTAFSLGRLGAGNQVVISNGGMLQTSQSIQIGQQASSSNNTVIVTGVGSRWDSLFDGIIFGTGGGGNRLLITNGGTVLSGQNSVGLAASSINNEVLVTDAGSLWFHTSISVGRSGAGNRLVITNGGRVFGNGYVHVGENSSSTNNRVVVDGTLTITNGAGGGLLDIRRGTNVLNAGLIDADILRLTNGGLSKFEFNGGTLSVKSSTVSNGQLFRVGNSVSPATLTLAGNGTHSFGSGLLVNANATLTGNGTVGGNVTVLTGGQISPGTSIGKIIFTNSVLAFSATLMEISKNGAALTNDQIQVTGTLTYGGMLAVSNLGPSPLAAGDNFKPFSATSYAGSFASLTLPPLGTGLNWTNKLLVDGSIEVVTWSGPKIGSVTLSGTNLIFSVTDGFPGGPYDVLTSTNIATPLTNWIILSSGAFDWLGNATVTNGIAPGELARFFRLRLP